MMELDGAIQNALKRNPMESAMYGVGQTLGRQYELRALPRDISSTEDLLGISLGIVGATEPRPVVPDVVDAGHECGDTLLDTTVGSYQLAYEPSTDTWALYKHETVEKRFLLFIPYSVTDPGVKLKFTGPNARNRFLNLCRTKRHHFLRREETHFATGCIPLFHQSFLDGYGRA